MPPLHLDPFHPHAPHKSTLVFLGQQKVPDAGLMTVLHRRGCEVHVFRKPAEALAYMERFPTELVVSELRMAEGTGIEVLNRASGIRPEAIRIIISSPEEKPVVLHTLAKGLVHRYIIAPWDNEVFAGIVREALDMQGELRERRLREIINSSDSLPSPPKFHNRLRSLLARDDSSIQSITTEIEKDPALVAKILRVVNSVYYGARTTIMHVRDAVVFIGTEYIASLVMAIEAFESLGKARDPQATKVIEQLWHQALRRATIARMIGAKWDRFRNPYLSYTAALLQDIGFVVRLAYEPERYYAFQRLCGSDAASMYDADIRTFGVSHNDVGASLLKFWNLPEEIVGAIARHHGAAGDDVLAQILQISDILESADASVPHDPAVDPLVIQWCDALRFKRPRLPQTQPVEQGMEAPGDAIP